MDRYLSDSGALDGDNYTLPATCVTLSFNSLNGTDISLYVDVGVRAVNVVMAEVYILLGNFLNILTLVLILRYKELHTLPFVAAAQIAISNATEACVIGFPAVINSIVGGWVLGENACIATAFLRFLCSSIRSMIYFIFSMDRFSVVFFPFVYPRYRRGIMLVMCVLSWSIGLLLSLVPIPPLLDCYGLYDSINSCFFILECGKGCEIFLRLWTFLMAVPCHSIAAGLFIALFVKGRKIRRKESKMLGLSHKTISDSDWRALKTISVLFGSFLVVSFLPAFLWQILQLLHGTTFTLVRSLSEILVNLVFITDPIIILRNADARSACRKLQLDIWQVCSHYYERLRGDSDPPEQIKL